MNGHTSWNNTDKESTRSRHRTSPNGERKRNSRRPVPRPHETEEEAILRRFHDAQRMARFRAKKKKALEEAKALDAAKLAEMAMINELKRRNVVFQITTTPNGQSASNTETVKSNNQQEDSMVVVPSVVGNNKYSQLLALIEELGRDIRLTYAGSRTSAERLKMGIIQARMLVRDCLLETEYNS